MKAPSGASREFVRVLIADSNQIQSQLLSSALRRRPGLRVACCRSEVSDSLQALRSAPKTRVINAKGEGMLTPREEEVVNLVAEGIGNREIAEQLGIKENTVKKSLLRTYDKLGVSNRVELVLYALTHRGAEKSAPRKRPPLSSHITMESLDSNKLTRLGADCGGILKAN